MKTIIILGTFVLSLVAHAEEDCAAKCSSQLLRVEIASSVLSNGAAQGLLPSLQKLSESPALVNAIQRSYQLQDIGFPQSQETCEREQSEGDPLFKNVNCQAPGLCSDPDLNPKIREKICFKLPCPILEGNLHVGKCQEVKEIYPNGISFPGDLHINKIGLTPTKVEYKNGAAKLCFNMNALELNINTTLSLDTRNTTLPDKSITMNNISPVLDKPREVCISANVNLARHAAPISNIKIEPVGSEPFISDQVIRTAAAKLKIEGLTGYPSEALAAIQTEVVPVIIQPLRSSIEEAVKTSLSKVFETELQRLTEPFTSGPSSSKTIDSRDLMSEIGLNNILVKDQLARVECAYIKAARQTIPPKHACVGMDDHFGTPITPENFKASPSNELSSFIRMSKGKGITSESLKQRLIALKDLMRQEQVDDFFREGKTPEQIEDLRKVFQMGTENVIREEVDPLINEITNNQMGNEVFKFVEIQNQIREGLSNNIGLSLPEICTEKPSPHANKRIPNCPIQVYADLNEFNTVLKKMWENGRMCMSGQGPYNPKRDQYGNEAYDKDGAPLVNGGCYFNVQGLGCYIKAPPQIKYDTKLKKYKVNLALQGCYRPPVILGLGKVGGDLNIDFSFDPKSCNNGDFCMEKPDAKWELVPGTGRFALNPSSLLNGFVTKKLDDAIAGAMKNTIRLPMASGVGPLAGIPLQAQGRTDAGPGYFGACLEIPKGAKAE